MYRDILKAVGGFGVWQAGKLAVLWVFMIILGAHSSIDRNPPEPDQVQGHPDQSRDYFPEGKTTSNFICLNVLVWVVLLPVPRLSELQDSLRGWDRRVRGQA